MERRRPLKELQESGRCLAAMIVDMKTSGDAREGSRRRVRWVLGGGCSAPRDRRGSRALFDEFSELEVGGTRRLLTRLEVWLGMVIEHDLNISSK
jgi:hypothetical protein